MLFLGQKRDLKRRLKSSVAIARNFCRDLLRDRIGERDNDGGGSMENARVFREDVGKRKDDILDTIVDANHDIEDMIDDTIVFLLAGYDTAGNVLSFTLGLLLDNPASFTKLRHHLKSDDRELTEIDWNEPVTYLDWCFTESMRLFPVGPVSERTHSNYGLQFDHYAIPPGTRTQVHIAAQHRNPLHWDNPDAFIPERWEGMIPLQWKEPGIYIPFMIGPRRCIGKNMALVQLRLVLTMLIKNLDFIKADNRKISEVHNFILMPRDGVKVRVI